VYDIQHCFICRPSNFTVSEDAGIEPRTVATKLRLRHGLSDALTARLDLIHNIERGGLTSGLLYVPITSRHIGPSL
jgi:hypothetical protein